LPGEGIVDRNRHMVYERGMKNLDVARLSLIYENSLAKVSVGALVVLLAYLDQKEKIGGRASRRHIPSY
jgi:hypothetical protein